MQGDIPSPLNAPSGCPFRTRCPYCKDECSINRPTLVELVKGHQVACHLYDKETIEPKKGDSVDNNDLFN